MRKSILHKLFLLTIIASGVLQSCKNDSYVLTPTPTVNQSFVEEFDTAAAAVSRGWKFINNSYPRGGGVWQNGGAFISPLFSAFSQQGTFPGYIGTDVNSTRTPTAADAAPYTVGTAPQGFISNWLISPEKIMQNGDKIIFYTRSQLLGGNSAADSTDWGNRLQVRINKHGTDYLVGDIRPYWEWLYTNSPNTAGDDAGSFDVVLLDINPFLHEWHKEVPGTSLVDGRAFSATTNIVAFPTKWTRFEATISGLDKPTLGRFAFRYFVPGGDPNNGYASGIGIDKLEYKSVNY